MEPLSYYYLYNSKVQTSQVGFEPTTDRLAYHYGFLHHFCLWSGLSLYHIQKDLGTSRKVSTPSSNRCLARDCLSH